MACTPIAVARRLLGGFVLLMALLAQARATAATPATTETSAQQTPPDEYVYRAGSEREPGLRLFVFQPTGGISQPRPAMLSFHGGGWHVGEASWTFATARRMAHMGVVGIAVQYRLSDQKRITPIEALADACASLHWVRVNAARLRIDPQRVGAHGVSAGGHLAAATAALGCGNDQGRYGNGGPDLLLLWSPAVDVADSGWFRRLLLGRGDPQAWSPAQQVRGLMPPTSIVQGAADTVTRLDGAQAFCTALRSHKAECELNVYPDLGHLLTRNLKHQEDDFDPDPQARDDGIRRHQAFVRRHWLAADMAVPR